MTRNDHVLPPGYLAHDSIDNDFLDLGSWYGLSQQILVDLKPPPQYLAVAAVPDVNGDGAIDQAVLVLGPDDLYYLRTINGVNGKQLKQIALGTKKEILPSGLASVGGNISVLVKRYSSSNTVLELHDNATLALVNTLRLPQR